MSKTPSDPSSRDLIQYHMFDLSIYYGLRYNFQISNSSTLWDTAASFMAVACIFQNIHMIFHTHHSCNSDLLYATSKPQKTHLMSHKGLYPTVENTSCMLNSSFDDFTTDFFFFSLSSSLFSVLPNSWLPLKNSTSFFFSRHSFRKQSAMRWLEHCRFTRLRRQLTKPLICA